MAAGEATGANQAAADEIHQQLLIYQRNPNMMTGANLGMLIGNLYGAPDSVTQFLQKDFIDHAHL